MLPTKHFPWVLFRLLSCDLCQWNGEISRLKNCHASCSRCMDVEFSTIVLDFAKKESDFARLRFLLEDISTFCPLSTDLVECLHGYSQRLLHRWRGAKPSDPVAQERQAWSLILRSYAKLRELMWDRYGDKAMTRRIHHFGHHGRNQYSKSCVESVALKQLKQPVSLDKMDAMLAFGQTSFHAPRKLCGDTVST